MFKSLITTILLAAALPTFADEHITLKGLHLGMTNTEITTTLQPFCSNMLPRQADPTTHLLGGYGTPFGNTPACTPFTIGGADVHVMEIKSYHGSVSAIIHMTLHPNNFEAIKEAINTKYPVQCVDKQMSNAMGATFTNTICRYAVGDDVMVLCKYMDLNTGYIAIETREFIEAARKASDATKNDL